MSRARHVGPVLETGELADAVIAAICAENAGVIVEDRGSYRRVLVPDRCVVTREAIEKALGRPFGIHVELEHIMPSFAGALVMTDDLASWTAGGTT